MISIPAGTAGADSKSCITAPVKIGLINFLQRPPGPFFFRQAMDIPKRDKSIKPAVESCQQCISGLVLLPETSPNVRKSATLQKFSGIVIRKFGAYSISPSIRISGYSRKEFAETYEHPKIVCQDGLSVIERRFRHAFAGAEWNAPGDPGRGEDHGLIYFTDAPCFCEFHAEVEVFSRLPAGRKTIGADITGSGKADAGADGVKGVR